MKLTAFTSTQSTVDIIPLMLRITFAIVLWPHGAQLLFGMFGGAGYTKSMQFLTGLGLPAVIGFLNIFLLSIGTLFILIGLFTHLFASAFIVLIIGMIFKAHVSYGFFMNWLGTQKGEGYEYHLLVLGIALSLLISGPGKKNLDYMITTARKAAE